MADPTSTPSPTRSRRRPLIAAAAIAAFGVLAGATGAFAGGTFSDVPPSHPFAEDIEAIAAAGITTGFTDGTFRPGQNVTRGAMAAFMGRGFSSASAQMRPAAAPVVIPLSDGDVAGERVSVAEVTVEPGAVGSGGGYVLLSGNASLFSIEAATACPCEFELQIWADNSPVTNPSYSQMGTEMLSSAAGTYADAFLSTTGVVPIPADTPTTYTLLIRNFGSVGAGGAAVSGDLTALYVPFSDGISMAGLPDSPATADQGGRSMTR